jgi:hypothetical protein
MVAKLKAIKVEFQRRKHHRSSEVGAWLRKVVNGYYQYHAVPGNLNQMRTFRQRVNWPWRGASVRRSQRARKKWELLYGLPTSCPEGREVCALVASPDITS